MRNRSVELKLLARWPFKISVSIYDCSCQREIHGDTRNFSRRSGACYPSFGPLLPGGTAVRTPVRNDRHRSKGEHSNDALILWYWILIDAYTIWYHVEYGMEAFDTNCIMLTTIEMDDGNCLSQLNTRMRPSRFDITETFSSVSWLLPVTCLNDEFALGISTGIWHMMFYKHDYRVRVVYCEVTCIGKLQITNFLYVPHLFVCTK